jgi:hypothetical protein
VCRDNSALVAKLSSTVLLLLYNRFLSSSDHRDCSPRRTSASMHACLKATAAAKDRAVYSIQLAPILCQFTSFTPREWIPSRFERNGNLLPSI